MEASMNRRGLLVRLPHRKAARHLVRRGKPPRLRRPGLKAALPISMALILAAGAEPFAACGWAQPPGIRRPRSAQEEGGIDRRLLIFRSLDRNGNGVLEPAEVPERLRQRMRERLGIDLSQPVPVQQIAASLQNRSGKQEGPEETTQSATASSGDAVAAGEDQPGAASASPASQPEGAEGAGQKGAAAASSSQSAESAASQGEPGPAAAATATSDGGPPKVPGFGVQQDLPTVAGFGAPQDAASADAAGTAAGERQGTGSGSESERGKSPNSSAERKIRRYAESLLKQYDRNKNGVLERDEWKNMRGDPAKSDANGDGVITVDELQKRLSNYTRRRSSWSSSSSSSGTAESSTRYTNSGSGGLVRERRPPEGLPGWFNLRDADRDGQVAMAEYASSWTDAKAAEFQSFDLNGDGIITPKECQAVAGGK